MRVLYPPRVVVEPFEVGVVVGDDAVILRFADLAFDQPVPVGHGAFERRGAVFRVTRIHHPGTMNDPTKTGGRGGPENCRTLKEEEYESMKKWGLV